MVWNWYNQEKNEFILFKRLKSGEQNPMDRVLFCLVCLIKFTWFRNGTHRKGVTQLTNLGIERDYNIYGNVWLLTPGLPINVIKVIDKLSVDIKWKEKQPREML